MSLGDEKIVDSAGRGGVSEHPATDAEEQVERRPLSAGGLTRRFGKQPWSRPLDEVEGEFPDPLEFGQHADQDFGSHRVRPCT